MPNVSQKYVERNSNVCQNRSNVGPRVSPAWIPKWVESRSLVNQKYIKNAGTTLGPTWDLLWTYIGFTFGHTFDLRLTYFGLTFGPTFGPTLDLLWTYFGPTLDLLWIYFRSTFDQRWTYFGPTLDLLLIYFWFTLDLLWTYFGPTFDLLLTYFGPTFDLLLVCTVQLRPRPDLLWTYFEPILILGVCQGLTFDLLWDLSRFATVEGHLPADLNFQIRQTQIKGKCPRGPSSARNQFLTPARQRVSR